MSEDDAGENVTKCKPGGTSFHPENRLIACEEELSMLTSECGERPSKSMKPVLAKSEEGSDECDEGEVIVRLCVLQLWQRTA